MYIICMIKLKYIGGGDLGMVGLIASGGWLANKKSQKAWNSNHSQHFPLASYLGNGGRS